MITSHWASDFLEWIWFLGPCSPKLNGGRGTKELPHIIAILAAVCKRHTYYVASCRTSRKYFHTTQRSGLGNRLYPLASPGEPHTALELKVIDGVDIGSMWQLIREVEPFDAIGESRFCFHRVEK
jgi:hypothetical protein